MLKGNIVLSPLLLSSHSYDRNHLPLYLAPTANDLEIGDCFTSSARASLLDTEQSSEPATGDLAWSR